jgi:large subunit ribosomal protein L18
MKAKTRQDYRTRRHWRIRKRISGTAERPRLALTVSNRRIAVQFIDDTAAVTLAAAASAKADGGLTVETARAVGSRAAQAAREKGIRRVVVDRGGFRYHGRIKALVEAVEAGGIALRTQPVSGGESEGCES